MLVLSIFLLSSIGDLTASDTALDYDYVIVGGGTAGCVLASRLSEDPDVTVLLLEAGPDPTHDSFISNPRSFINVFTNPDYDWGYVTEPQEHLGSNQGIPWQQGKLLGGSGTHNAMFYTRGSRHDYDRWEELGNKGWSYDDVLPYFKKSEQMYTDEDYKEFMDDEYHGFNGEMQTRISHTTPFMKEVIKGGVELGFKATDYHGSHLENTISPAQVHVNIRGQRSSTVEAFLRPVMARRNLKVITEAVVTKINIIKHDGAKGVYFTFEDKIYYAEAKIEVIVAAGSLNTPKLLMLSGVGPKEHLNNLGIEVISDLPVGNNLENHYAITVPLEVSPSSPVKMEKLFSFQALFEYVFTGKGPWSSPVDIVISHYRLKNQPQEDLFPHMEQHFIGPFFILDNYPTLMQAVKNKFKIPEVLLSDLIKSEKGHGPILAGAMHLHSRTRGSIRLKSDNPIDKPVINYLYLDNEDDRNDYVRAIRVLQTIENTTAFKKAGIKLNSTPNLNCLNHNLDSDEYWKCYLGHNVFTHHHFTSTCRMAPDSSGVVDEQLRVKHVKNLRVVDASIMPQSVSGHTHAATIMIAEKAADMVKQQYKDQGHRNFKNKYLVEP